MVLVCPYEVRGHLLSASSASVVLRCTGTLKMHSVDPGALVRTLKTNARTPRPPCPLLRIGVHYTGDSESGQPIVDQSGRLFGGSSRDWSCQQVIPAGFTDRPDGGNQPICRGVGNVDISTVNHKINHGHPTEFGRRGIGQV